MLNFPRDCKIAVLNLVFLVLTVACFDTYGQESLTLDEGIMVRAVVLENGNLDLFRYCQKVSPKVLAGFFSCTEYHGDLGEKDMPEHRELHRRLLRVAPSISSSYQNAFVSVMTWCEERFPEENYGLIGSYACANAVYKLMLEIADI